MSKIFSQRLIALRKEKNLTQEGLAKILNKTRSSISGYETQGKEPDLEGLRAMAELFGVTTDYLIGADDQRTHTESVFVNDTYNFKKSFDALPVQVKQIVAKSFDSYYLLLYRDMQSGNEERLDLYRQLISALQVKRADIRNTISLAKGDLSDPIFLSDIMEKQNDLKTEISALLDKLMRADIDSHFNIKKDDENSANVGT